ncbi:hypothetical protein OHC33_010877 [Knufia fluminis]|uniref:MMS19 nucleotide excision repair protein n=1 Tax=Knufia fluminis TaxID=191047 RepID=A0AAN8E7R9_9EURO|nr:hypothetical protein OHC33_010877 [Knufia fluminis]
MAEDDARAYVLAFENNKDEATRVASQTAQKLQNGEYKLVDVIKATGEYLQNTDPKIRERATNYLSAIISALPPKALTRHDIPVLNVFLCSRIQDGGAIEGLSKLQSLDRYSKENAQELAQAMFDNFSDMSDRKQAERYQVYMLLNELLSNHRQAMLDMGDKSLLGYVRVVGGEKDPRNLMLIFSMLRVFMIEWDISKHVDTMFDAVYAYFPITFRPPPNDPYGITAQDLKDRLKDCLASTGELAPSTFPNLLDRLDSTSEVVKKDVLQALAACAMNYNPATIAQFSIPLWDAVKFEVLQAQEPFLADEALNVIKNIATCLSRKTSPHVAEWKADPLIQYLKPINKECLEHLQEPASRQAGASGDILKAAASATARSFDIVMKAVGPALFNLQQSSEGINNQRAILSVVNKIFEASIEVYGSWTVPSKKNEDGHPTLLAEFKDRLLAIYSRALMSTVREEVSYRLAAVRGLLLLAEQWQLLDENEIGLVVQHFNEIVLDEESYGRDELKQRAMQALAQISQFKPRLITDITFPKFIARLPDDEAQAAGSKDYRSVLEGLAEISVGRDLLETLIRRLLNKLDLLVQTSGQQYPYTGAILSTTYYVLDRSARDPTLSLDSYFDRVVVGFSNRAATALEGPLANETVLTLLGKAINLIIRRSSNEHKDQAAQNVYNLFRETNSNGAGHTSLILPSNALTLSTWILAALPKTANAGILGEPLIPLIRILRKQADRNTSTKYSVAIEQACLKQVAILINRHISKQEDIAEIEAFFRSAIDCVSGTNVQQPEEAERDWQCAVRFLFTISKACLLRLLPLTDQILMQLVNLLQTLPPEKARYLALGFGTLLAQDEILSKTNGAQIRLLAPQRVFQKMVPMFSEHFRDPKATQEQKEIYLIALSGILGSVSSDIVMPELPTLLPLLLQSLELSDANQSVKAATLETMIVVITKNPDALIESGHIPALTRRLIAAATLRKPAKNARSLNSPKSPDTTMMDAPSVSASISSPKTRQLALHCIALLPQHIKDQKTPNPLLTLKREVLNGLANCLDDPRRDVRKEAVDARARWLRNLDDVDESDED